MSATTTGAAAVDLVFDVAGETLPADHALPLRLAVERWLPWFGEDPGAGIHPLRANATGYGVVLLAHRAKLVLRVPEARREAALVLEGRTLDVGGSRLAVGSGRPRPLRPSATLCAAAVTFGVTEETAFHQAVAAALEGLGVAAAFISGRARTGCAGDRLLRGFGLTLHDLNPADSLRLQAQGLGGGRALGWGVFVPAKTITCPP